MFDLHINMGYNLNEKLFQAGEIMVFYARDFGILPEKEVGGELCAALEKMSATDGEKTLVFEKGVYYINSDNCKGKMLYITNTVGDGEFKDGETPHYAKIALNFQNISNLTVRGNGAEFIIDGKVTNIAAENCENLTIDGLGIDVKNPHLHEFTVEKVTPFSVTFALDRISEYEKEGKSFYFVGKDYREDFFADRMHAGWTALVKNDDINCVQRTSHPFAGALGIREIGDRRFKLGYLSTRRFSKGDRYYVFNPRREFVGVFVNRCKNFSLKNFSQRFNYSLAIVCQDTENITIDGADLSPSDSSGRLICSLADFIQICCCKGRVSVTDSNFCGACDDAVNVHGIHMYIDEIRDNKLILSFRHPQTHGFNPFHTGDEIEYIDRQTLESKGRAKILESRLISEYKIEMTVDSVSAAQVGMAVEDITMCPEFYYGGNTLNRIITRNILVTTRNRVLIENNKFLNSSMDCILLSDDAKSWYESGPCHDVEIRNNYFGDCKAHFINIMPENANHKNTVHKNIKITGNTFDSLFDRGISVKCAENVVIRNNTIKNTGQPDNFVRFTDTKNIVNDF